MKRLPVINICHRGLTVAKSWKIYHAGSARDKIERFWYFVYSGKLCQDFTIKQLENNCKPSSLKETKLSTIFSSAQN